MSYQSEKQAALQVWTFGAATVAIAIFGLLGVRESTESWQELAAAAGPNPTGRRAHAAVPPLSRALIEPSRDGGLSVWSASVAR